MFPFEGDAVRTSDGQNPSTSTTTSTITIAVSRRETRDRSDVGKSILCRLGKLSIRLWSE
jgi:hypothetical protein